MGQRAEGPTGEPRVFLEGVRPQRVVSTRWSVLLAFVVTTLTCLLSGALKSMAGEIAAIWLTNAVLLGQMMVVAPRQRYWVLAGGIAGNLAANLISESLAVSLSYTLADTLEVLIAFSFAPRLSTVADLLRPKALLRFLAGGVILAPLLSGLLATTLLRSQLSGHLLPNLANWFVSDALSLVIFTPAAVVFWNGEAADLLRADRRLKTLALLLLVCAVTAGVFSQSRFPLLYWALLPIVLLAFQVDLAGVMVGLLLCLAIAVSFTMRGIGPLWIFPYEDMEARIFSLQLFLFAALCIALPISATQVSRGRLVGLLREGERRYRILAENATDIVMSVTLEGRLTYVSPRAQTVMRRNPDELIGAYLPDLVIADDRDALATAIENLAIGASEISQVSRFRRPDGQILWLETYLRPVIDPFSGQPEALTATTRDITVRKAAEQRLADERIELQGLAFRDGLTGLFNRRHFDLELANQWRQVAEGDGAGFTAVVMIDIDAYKSYNDHYGHQRGDDCLRTIAQTIALSARRPTDIVARYGGEEFALILKETDLHGARVVAERIRRAVEGLQVPHHASDVGMVTVSLGVAARQPREGGGAASLVAAADRALYEAKRRGRNQTFVAEDGDAGPGSRA
ncbi:MULTISPECIES: bifunctional diguanylate cyclase/phosphodiesterase [Paraburkholderia]|jgi:diguanylate cyclase (GGDEF)-like protein/PAS domain S-box-containing protein|uniref:diguanylate cyclase n=1 Tax=Paraburkholderia phenazinium TaxID=60549 RepID=A0A1N6GM46_9BURK|nr:GGDEF domain-containing protein [Paraburkholderia phenazinium]SIO08576.1 PAS domain S-box-containing protein/diguanylate cyclase (GGDEF) domain-containing protein [Paraburkholderia phenazinium]